jgi:soluble lytic murein transglycosylase
MAESSLRSSKYLIFELAMLYDHYGLTWNSMRWCQFVWDSIHGEERRKLSRAFSLLLHPLPFPVQVFENCARQGLPPHLVYAMIRAESGFDKTAVSRAGAIGLMQLMPGTGRDVARRLDLPDDFGEDLFSPEVNLAFGIWYASFLFSKCGENPFMMLAAYNAGLSNARRWFRNQQQQTVPRVVDGITYKETRNYVKKIIESSHVYHDLYFDSDASHISLEHSRQ